MTKPDQSSLKPGQRLPPPFLFQGPSRNASSLSLTNGNGNGAQAPSKAPSTSAPSPVLPQASSSRVSVLNDIQDIHDIHDIHDIRDIQGLNLLPTRRKQTQPQRRAEGADALWDQMQSTLAEVELAAMGGDRVFGSYHPEVVESLRAKQLSLAQAWARTEAEEVPNSVSSIGDTAFMETDEGNPREVLDEKTERDITHARKRREANDRYFERVNNGVLDVVAKLEDVAQTMREVASKSKEVWSESGSVQTPVGSDG
ncbi:uncharacterized protein GIQ15_05618 [Arthroderma uncinatum]|uniref:uncharacterized protein n=1 Tax=Arthroderma uncinatum TaxID=74035 RepID=UPI00144AED56|nr:uncharacterized protein GIQ15_05618 [Arthroderma uncinatum]KAF3480271.1 hypothetical protein GIQ15_05618 [Arthroderma uncinatum]